MIGWPLAGGDSRYDSLNIATKIRSAGVSPVESGLEIVGAHLSFH